LISGLYKIDKHGYCDEGDGAPILSLTWPGTRSLCYAEPVGFYTKRDNPNTKYVRVWKNLSCKALGYGSKRKCNS